MKLLATRKINGEISHKDTTVVEKQKITENLNKYFTNIGPRGGSRTAATSKMECFVIIVNGFQLSLTVITKRSILDPAVVLDPALRNIRTNKNLAFRTIGTVLWGKLTERYKKVLIV